MKIILFCADETNTENHAANRENCLRGGYYKYQDMISDRGQFFYIEFIDQDH